MNQTKVGADGAGSGALAQSVTTNSAATQSTSSSVSGSGARGKANVGKPLDGASDRGANPSYLGIKDADKNTYRDTLQRFAAVDFWHDFHHVKTTPILDRLGKSYNVNSGLSVREYQSRVLTLRGAYQGKTLYDRFESDPTNVMLLGSNAASVITAKSEDDVLDSLLPANYKYNTLRKDLVDTKIYTPDKIELNKNVAIGASQEVKRSYTISAVQAKYPGKENELFIASSFRKVSNETRNFILMIDASFLAMSKIFELVENNDADAYNFFIIQSVENEGDPATKIGNFSPSQNPKVNVYFLKDTGHKTYYTPYEGGKGDNSNLFSGCSISAYRDSDDLITADIQSARITATIDNIGTASEPNEAGFLAFQRLISKGETNKDEAFVYYLLKRAGDWCQALCLLDRGRTYSIYPYGSYAPIGAPTSLDQLMKGGIPDGLKGTFEIALLTHDKILLSYALLLGLNVFYTIKTVSPSTSSSVSGSGSGTGSDSGDQSSTSVTWLTYFKNTLDADPNAIINAANQKLENIQNDIKKIDLILNNSNNDISTINFDGIDKTKLVSDISTLYKSIPSMVIQKINKTKILDENQQYKKGFLTDFLSTTRVVLDLVSKIAAKPSDSIQTIITPLMGMGVPTKDTAEEFFSMVSVAQTTVHTYLQIVQFAKKLENLTDGEIQTILQEEYTKIKELEAILQSDKPIVLANKAHVEPYQYFLFTTLPAIQKDYKTFQSLFPVVPGAAVGAGQGAGPNIKDALRLEIDKYKIKDRPVPRQRTLDLWENKIGLWYQEYSEGINSTSTTQGGGGIQTGGGTIEELFSKKWIKTREAPQGEEYENIIYSLVRKYTLPDKTSASFIEIAKYIYQNKINNDINQYEIFSFIEDVLNLTLIYYLDNNGKFNNGNINNGLFVPSMNDALALFSELYTRENTTLDVGTTITYNDGLGYTLLDDCILTKEEKSSIEELILDYTNNPSETNLRKNNMKILYYRYLLLKLDEYTNEVHTVALVIDDFEKNVVPREPYYSDNNELYLQKIVTCVENVNSFLISLNISQLASLPRDLNEETAEATFGPVDKDNLLRHIAQLKETLIINFLTNTIIMEFKEGGALGVITEREREKLDTYQTVRLYYLLYHSNEDILAELPKAPSTSTLTSTSTPSKNQTINDDDITLANIFQYINLQNTFPPGYEEYIPLIKDHLDAYGDDFYKFARDPVKLAENKNDEQWKQATMDTDTSANGGIGIGQQGENQGQGEGAAGAGAGAPEVGTGAPVKKLLRVIEAKTQEQLKEDNKKKEEQYKQLIELLTGKKAREVVRKTRTNAAFKETLRARKAVAQIQRRLKAVKQSHGGKRYTKTRSKPKMRKDTRKSNKKYRSKTRRIHKI